FAEGVTKSIRCKVYPRQNGNGQLNVEVLDQTGHRAVRVVFGPDGHIRATDGAKSFDAGAYKPNTWYAIEINVRAGEQKYDVSVDGRKVVASADFMEPAATVDRLCFRTGDVYLEPTRETSRDIGGRDVAGAGEPVAPATYNIDDVMV